MSFARAIATVGGITMVSRIAGFIRDTLMTRILGAGPEADAFFVAFRLPNLFRSLFAEGAFTASFLPLFSATLTREGRDPARALAEESLAMLVAALLLISGLAALFMPALTYLIASGFADRPEQFDLAVELSRITFPYLMLISLTAVLGSILNTLGHLGPFAAAPILLNLVQITGLLSAQALGLHPALVLSYGVPVAGVAQFVWMALALQRAGFALRLIRPRLTPGVKRLFVVLGPGVLGAGVYQINLLVGTHLASLLPVGSISYLNYADRLNQLPMGVVGIAIGTALLPLLSRSVAAGNRGEVRHYLSRGLEFGLLLGLPAAVALVAIPETIISVLWQAGRFGPAEAQATAAALAAYAIGIPATVAARVLSAAYFARQDTKGPVRVAVVVLVTNVLLSLALIGPLAHVGLALAPGLTAWLNVALLAWGLKRRGELEIDPRVWQRGWRIALACALMAAGLVFGAGLLHPLLTGTPGIVRWAALGVLIAVGAALYGLLVLLFRGARLSDLKSLRRPAA